MDKPKMILENWLSYQKEEERSLKVHIEESENRLKRMNEELKIIQEDIKSVEEHIEAIPKFVKGGIVTKPFKAEINIGEVILPTNIDNRIAKKILESVKKQLANHKD